MDSGYEMRTVGCLIEAYPIRPSSRSMVDLETVADVCSAAVSFVSVAGNSFGAVVAVFLLGRVEFVNVLLLSQGKMGSCMCCLQNAGDGGLPILIRNRRAAYRFLLELGSELELFLALSEQQFLLAATASQPWIGPLMAL